VLSQTGTGCSLDLYRGSIGVGVSAVALHGMTQGKLAAAIATLEAQLQALWGIFLARLDAAGAAFYAMHMLQVGVVCDSAGLRGTARGR
jgi:hypothetical protein